MLPLYYLPTPSPTPGATPAVSGGHPRQQSHVSADILQQQQVRLTQLSNADYGSCAPPTLPFVPAGALYQAAPLLYPLAPPPPSHLLAMNQPLLPHHDRNHNHPSTYQDASDDSQKGCRTSGEEETEAEDSGSGSGSGMRGQSSSSYTYSFLRSDDDSCRGATAGAEDMLWERMDNSSTEGTSKRRPVLKDPPWLENVDVTPDLMLRYQVAGHELDAVLKADLQKLRALSQPALVDEQLGQLYLDMARAGANADFDADLHLDEAELTSSSCGSGNDSADAAPHKTRKKRRSLEYGKLVMIFEENAPMPSPVLQPA